MLAYDRTDILLITFSVVARNSFKNVKDLWLKELEKNRAKFTNAKVRRVHNMKHTTVKLNTFIETLWYLSFVLHSKFLDLVGWDQV